MYIQSNVSDKNLQIKHEELQYAKNCYRDDLYHKLNELKGLIGHNKHDNKNAIETMNAFALTVINLLEKRVITIDAILILCYEYCKDNNEKLRQLFIETLKNTVKNCLSSSKEFNILKARNYYFFKQYLLHSNIWLCKSHSHSSEPSTNTTNNNNNNHILYKYISETVDKELLKQQEYIWNHVKMEEKNESENWKLLLNFEQDHGWKFDNRFDHSNDEENLLLRQDLIENGTKPQLKYIDLCYIKSKLDSDNNNNYDIISKSTNNIYLTQCLINAHSMNSKFQNEMKLLFDKIASQGNFNIKFQSAPGQTEDRCIIKSQTDYNKRKYQRSACIVDFLRCSVTFDNVKDLLHSANEFMSLSSSSSKTGNQFIRKILRIKSGFKNIQKWKSIKDCNYCDLKFNIIVYDIESNISMIGEIQLLLKWLLMAKKIGHKLYGIKRKEEFIESNCNLIYNIDGNYDKYCSKISVMIENNDYNGIGNELLLEPNLILSIVAGQNPLLTSIASTKNAKLAQLFLSSLFYFDSVLLLSDNSNDNKKHQQEQEQEQKQDPFLKRYFNYNCQWGTIEYWHFWGIDTTNMNDKNGGNTSYNLVNSIMKCKYFDGMSQIKTRDKFAHILYFICEKGYLPYFKLIINNTKNWNYWKRNDNIMNNVINFTDGSGESALSTLVNQKHCNKEWINLFFNYCDLVNVQLDSKIVSKAFARCQNHKNDNFKHLADLIESYANKKGIILDTSHTNESDDVLV